MEIYVVQPNDNIYSIAARFGVSAEKLILDNGLESPYELVHGQAIVITYPKETYIVKEGDTLQSISVAHGVSVMQLLRNNPFLSDRAYIYPGETLTISFNTDGKIVTNGFAFPYIKNDILKKTLPYLTYLTVYNYRVTSGGEIITYNDDFEIIRRAKEYGVMPLLLATTISPQGIADIQTIFDILLNSAYQERVINNLLNIVREKGYYGINIVLNYISTTTQKLYQDFITKLSDRLNNEGYLLFATINPVITNTDNEVQFEQVDYSGIAQAFHGLIFVQMVWGTNINEPAPISSIYNVRAFLDYVVTKIPPDKIIVGMPLVSVDWELPYIHERSRAYIMTLKSSMNLARDVGATIQFDEVSETPYFYYERFGNSLSKQHIVWSVDARSLLYLSILIKDFRLSGAGLWNIMEYTPELWLTLNTQFEIMQLLPVST